MNLPQPLRGATCLALLTALWASVPSIARSESQFPVGQPPSDPSVPLDAARRWPLAEPLGQAPSPWAALAGSVETTVQTDGATATSALRIHVPVASHYGAVDFRLAFDFNDEGLRTVSPQLTLRALPLRLAGGRGALGIALGAQPALVQEEPTLPVRGGVMGGYLGEKFLAWGYVGLRGDPLQGHRLLLDGTVALSLRLPYGLRPHIEVDSEQDLKSPNDWTITVRPALRYWPTAGLGFGVAASIPTSPDNDRASLISFDVVGHALE